jgi:membrane-anchored protein YejM (alkaline phosphatase superfamily)
MRRNNGTTLHGQTPGFLGKKHSSFAIDQDLLGENVTIQAVEPNEDLTAIRISARRDLLQQFDEQRKVIDQSADAKNLDAFYQRAFNLISSSRTRTAFDLASESPKTRARYGKTEFGQRCLLARRLAQAGVPMVNVSYCHTPAGSWDTHSQNFKKMKDSLGPTLDTSLTALVEDLDERGMLDETLVVVNAEFGRTPAINKNSGRDHWPWVYSLVLAGAGIQAGTIYGSSDDSAAYPKTHPHDPADMAATIYHLLGINPDTMIYDKLNRGHQLIIGRPIEAILV